MIQVTVGWLPSPPTPLSCCTGLKSTTMMLMCSPEDHIWPPPRRRWKTTSLFNSLYPGISQTLKPLLLTLLTQSVRVSWQIASADAIRSAGWFWSVLHDCRRVTLHPSCFCSRPVYLWRPLTCCSSVISFQPEGETKGRPSHQRAHSSDGDWKKGSSNSPSWAAWTPVPVEGMDKVKAHWWCSLSKTTRMPLPYQLVLPEELRPDVLKNLHDNMGHLGIERTLDLVRARFFWPKMAGDVEHKIKTCGRCVRRKTLPNKSSPLLNTISSRPLNFSVWISWASSLTQVTQEIFLFLQITLPSLQWPFQRQTRKQEQWQSVYGTILF